MRDAVPLEHVRRIVLAAGRAPSAENCQPFCFSWDGAALSVHYDRARGTSVLNRNDHASYVALGCVLEAIAIEATAHGLRAGATLSLEEARGPWATVRFERSAEGVHELEGALDARATDRRFFRGGSLSDPVFAAIRRDAERFPRAAIHAVARPSKELFDYLIAAESYVWCHPDALRDVMRWMRLSREELEATRDGMAWNSFGIDLPETRLLGLCRSPLLERLAGPMGLGALSKRWLERQLASSAGLLCVTVRSTSKEDLVAAGGLGFVAWLRLNQAGYGVQPLASAALLAYNAVTDSLPPTAEASFVALFGRGPEIMARGFNAPSGALPVWMLRTGISPPLAPQKRAPRRALDEIFVDLRPGFSGGAAPSSPRASVWR